MMQQIYCLFRFLQFFSQKIFYNKTQLKQRRLKHKVQAPFSISKIKGGFLNELP